MGGIHDLDIAPCCFEATLALQQFQLLENAVRLLASAAWVLVGTTAQGRSPQSGKHQDLRRLDNQSVSE
jgi:hypothetical protein